MSEKIELLEVKGTPTTDEGVVQVAGTALVDGRFLKIEIKMAFEVWENKSVRDELLIKLARGVARMPEPERS